MYSKIPEIPSFQFARVSWDSHSLGPNSEIDSIQRTVRSTPTIVNASISTTMDSIINFLGANPYQAIAVPVIGGLATGKLPRTPYPPSNSLTREGYLGITRSSIKDWYPTLRNSALRPPNWAFGPAWTTLYCTMGFSSHIIARTAMETLSEPRYALARAGLGIYAVQLGVNLLWTPLFFGRRNPKAALVDVGVLGGLAMGMTGVFWQVDRLAGLLCLPSLGWLGFVTYLNYQIVKLNPGD